MNLDALARALLHTLWQGAAIAAVAAAALRAIPARKSGLRYGLCLLALAGVLMAGVGTWAVLDFHASAPVPHSAAKIAATPALPPLAAASSFSASTVSPANATPKNPMPWTAWIAGFWFCGVAIFLVRAASALLGAGRLCRQAREVTEEWIAAQAEELLRGLGLARHIRLLVSERVHSPAVIGFIRPAVLLPASLLTGMPPEYLRAVLAHEFAHVARWDYLVNIAQMIVEALLFFNPFVWWLSRQVRREREACCDHAAASQCGSRVDYLEALLACAETGAALPAAALAAGGGEKTLLDRARRLLHPDSRPIIRIQWPALAGVLGISGLALCAMLAGAKAAVKILSPKERIDQITQIQKDYSPSNLADRDIHVSGQVFGPDGRPISNAENGEIEIRSEKSNSVDSTSAEFGGGKFSRKLPSGVIFVTAWLPGAPPASIGPFRTDQDLTGLKINLVKGFEEPLRVVNEDGAPLPNAHISGYYGGPSNIGELPDTPDAHGQVLLPSDGRSTVTLDIAATGYEDYHAEDILLAPGKPVQCVLKRATVVRGQVVAAETGQPLSGAVIKLASIFGPYQNSDEPKWAKVLAKTDARGRFSIDHLREDAAYRFYVEAGNRRLIFERPAGLGAQPLNITMPPPLTVSGRIIWSGSDRREVVVGCTQSLETQPHSIDEVEIPQISEESRHGVCSFSIAGLYPADTEIHVNDGKPDAQTVKLAHFDKSRGDLVISLDSGIVQDAAATPKTRPVIIHFDVPRHAPLPVGSIMAFYREDHRDYADHAVTLENGEARVSVPISSEINLEPEGMIGYSFQPQSDIPIADGTGPAQVHVQTFPAGAIYGEMSEVDGSPARSVFISVDEVDSPKSGSPLHLDLKSTGGGQSDLQRRFVATPIPFGGDYSVLIWRDATFVISPPCHIDERTPIQNVKLVIPDGITLRCRVTDDTGKPIPGLAMSLAYTTPWGANYGSNCPPTDNAGQFEFHHVNVDASGSYWVSLDSRATYLPVKVPLDLHKSVQEVRLTRGRIIEGSAINAVTGQPMSNVQVFALYASYQDGERLTPGFDVFEAEAPTGADGQFRFSNLPDADFKLGIRNSNYADPGHPIAVHASQSDPVVLKLLPSPEDN